MSVVEAFLHTLGVDFAVGVGVLNTHGGIRLTYDVKLLPIGVRLVVCHCLVGHIDGDGAVYVIERLGADNRRHEGADVYLLQFGAEGEGVIANLAHAAREGHVFEVGAAVESGVSNLSNALGDGEVLQLVAVVERLPPLSPLRLMLSVPILLIRQRLSNPPISKPLPISFTTILPIYQTAGSPAARKQG